MNIPCCNNCGASLNKIPKRQFAQCEYCQSGLLIAGTTNCIYTIVLDDMVDYKADLVNRTSKLQKSRGKEPVLGALVGFIYGFIVFMTWMVTSVPAFHMKFNPEIHRDPGLVVYCLVFAVCLMASGSGAIFTSGLGYFIGVILAIIDDYFRPLSVRRVDLRES